MVKKQGEEIGQVRGTLERPARAEGSKVTQKLSGVATLAGAKREGGMIVDYL